LDPSGNLALIGTFSGKGIDHANGIAVDPSGNIYIGGNTTCVAYTTGVGIGSETGFLMKLAPDGSLIYSTYLGGTLGPSSMNSVAADAGGNACVTGWTVAADYPHTPGLPAGLVSTSSVEYITAAFFAKIDPAGSRIAYAGAASGLPSCGAICQGGGLDRGKLYRRGSKAAMPTSRRTPAAAWAALLASGTGAFCRQSERRRERPCVFNASGGWGRSTYDDKPRSHR